MNNTPTDPSSDTTKYLVDKNLHISQLTPDTPSLSSHPQSSRLARVVQISLIIAVVISSFALAWWQWSRFHSPSGSFQNLGYTLQWPVFGLFALYAYRQFIVLDKKRAIEQRQKLLEDYVQHNGITAADFTAKTNSGEAKKHPRTEIPPNFLPSIATAPTKNLPPDPLLEHYNKVLREIYEQDNHE